MSLSLVLKDSLGHAVTPPTLCLPISVQSEAELLLMLNSCSVVGKNAASQQSAVQTGRKKQRRNIKAIKDGSGYLTVFVF